jgi:hypothetical protein
MKAYGDSGCIDPHFLDLGTSWRRVLSFTPRPLCPQGKIPRYPLDRRLGGPQSRSGWLWEKKILDPSRTRNSDRSVVQPIAIRYTDCATAAHSLITETFIAYSMHTIMLGHFANKSFTSVLLKWFILVLSVPGPAKLAVKKGLAYVWRIKR